MNSYNTFTYIIILVTNLCLFRSLVYGTELILLVNLYLSHVGHILMLVSDVYLFRSPKGHIYRTYTCLTDLILVLQSIYLYIGSYNCITELILVFQSLYLYYKTYSCISDLILILRNLYLYYGTYSYAKVPVGSYWFISPEGHIFVLISDSYTYTGVLIHVLVLITDIYLSNLL